MEELESKYRRDALTPDELERLRQHVNTSSDIELSKSMHKAWNEEANESYSEVLSSNLFDRIKEKIQRIERPQLRFRIVRWAAVITIGLLLSALTYTSVHFYNENRDLEEAEMVITTGVAERASVTLPDGTNITINSESTLKYAPHSFNREKRIVDFVGEAYFDVHQNEQSPFIINTTAIKVRVLGTRFNLKARESDSTTSLILEQGKVAFTSIKTGEERHIFPNQSAIYNKHTDTIMISDVNAQRRPAWQSEEWAIYQISLENIIKTLSELYGVKIKIAGNISISTDLFSGTLPIKNMAETFMILEKTYNIRIELTDNEIILWSI